MKHILTLLVLSTLALSDFIRIWAGGHIPLEQSSTNSHIWILGKHFVPIVPNARIEHTSFTAGTQESKKIDLILYYNLLDNLLWATLDIGAGLSVDGDLEFKGLDQIIGFARARAEIPTTTIGVEGSIKRSILSGKDDIELKADIEIMSIPLLEIAVEAGYKISDINDIKTIDAQKISNNQSFLGLVAKF